MAQRTAYFLLVGLISILTTGCTLLPSTERSRVGAPGASGPTPTPIPTPIVPTKPVYQVQKGEVVDIIEFTGRVAPVVEKELFFRVGGRVRDVYVDRNDLVTEGQVLADLEIDDLERELASGLLELERADQELAEAEQAHADELARAQSNLEIAEANLAEASTNQAFALAEAKINLASKQLQLTKAQNEDPTQRQILAKADLEEARIALKQAQEAYDEIAYSDSVGTSWQAVALQQATLDFERAQANYNLAMQDIENRGFDLDLLAQEIALAALDLEQLEAEGVNTRLAQEVAQAQLEVNILDRGIDPIFANNVQRARLNVEKLQAAITDAQVIAPFDGQVLSLSLTEGREGTAFKPIAIVANLDELEVSAEPLDSQLQDLTEGMAVTASLASRPGEAFGGAIRRLPYPYGGGGRSQGVEEEDTSTRISLEVSPKDIGLDQGDLIRLKIVLEEKSDVLWLPPQAIRTFDGRRFVVVQDEDAQRRVDVKIGIEGEDRVEIEEGVTEGQTIVGP